ncbi:MAG: hypothetical protein EBS19_05835 [Spirochaetia bacterium]|jgi:guanylate kinase|nr:hypothetical protein [Spirochaetia bacterium]
MDKESVVNIMAEKFIEGNKFLGHGSGMSAEEVETKIQEGMIAIQYLLSEVYDALLANDLLK